MESSTEDFHKRKILHIGSGEKYVPDAVNIDKVEWTNPDIVHDLNVRPWPTAKNHFERVFAYDVIEHLDDIVATMEEIHDVCVNGATVHITAPHFSCANAFTDITHKHFFSSGSFNYFTGANEFGFYTRKRYEELNTVIIFKPTLLNKVVWRLANHRPAEYERRWAWIFPAWFLSFELKVVKNDTTHLKRVSV